MPTAMPVARFDSPWKDALEQWLPFFLALFVPHVHRDIDWSRGFVFLDTELARIAPNAVKGGTIVDKLARVTLLSGGDAYVLIHIEVQNQKDAGFARRMFRYHARLLDHFDVPVYSLAVLGDAHQSWRPVAYAQKQWDCVLELKFPTIKLLDYRDQVAALEANRNPFVTIVLGHLGALATKGDIEDRYRTKMQLVRRLYSLGYGKAEVVESYRLLDWLMRLPAAVERKFYREVIAYEEEQRMSYVSNAERFGIEKGIKQGRQEGRQEGRQVGREEGHAQGRAQGIALALRMRFGTEGELLATKVEALTDQGRLDRIGERLLAGATLSEVSECLS
jgi:hypothetical protein